jgi:hypothetical protein
MPAISDDLGDTLRDDTLEAIPVEQLRQLAEHYRRSLQAQDHADLAEQWVADHHGADETPAEQARGERIRAVTAERLATVERVIAART